MGSLREAHTRAASERVEIACGAESAEPEPLSRFSPPLRRTPPKHAPCTPLLRACCQRFSPVDRTDTVRGRRPSAAHRRRALHRIPVRYAPTRMPRIDRPSRVCTTTVSAVTDLSQLTRPDSGAGHGVRVSAKTATYQTSPSRWLWPESRRAMRACAASRMSGWGWCACSASSPYMS